MNEITTQLIMDAKIKDIVNGLADQNVFLINTNHLTDDQFYARLVDITTSIKGLSHTEVAEILASGRFLAPLIPEVGHQIDLAGREEDYEDYIAYYSTVGERAMHHTRTGAPIYPCAFVSNRDNNLPNPRKKDK